MVEQFNPSHYEQIRSWCRKRGLSPLPLGALSDLGYIVPGVAVGFLFTTNSQVAFVDMYLANPDCSKEQRDAAIAEINQTILNKAPLVGVKYIKLESAIPSQVKRALELGFKDVGTFTCLFKELD